MGVMYRVPMRVTVLVNVEVEASDPDEAVQLATDEAGYLDEIGACQPWSAELHGQVTICEGGDL
jgi:hypothetical protein